MQIQYKCHMLQYVEIHIVLFGGRLDSCIYIFSVLFSPPKLIRHSLYCIKKTRSGRERPPSGVILGRDRNNGPGRDLNNTENINPRTPPPLSLTDRRQPSTLQWPTGGWRTGHRNPRADGAQREDFF
jgi:hypothetical protein